MKKSDKKHIQMVTQMEKIAGISPNIYFKDIKNINPMKVEKIEQRRNEFKSTRNISISQTYSRIYPQLPSGVVILIIFGLLIGSVCPCDNHLFVLSNGKVCEKKICKNLAMASFPIQTGQSICFTDINDEQISITIESTYYRTQYHHMYDTSEFEIKMKTDSVCGTYCDPEVCRMNKKLDTFVEKKDRVQGFTCETKSSCNRYCVSDTSCTYIHWWLEPIGNVAKIYKFTRKIWEARILIKYKETNKIVVLNLNNPSYQIQINDISFSVINSLPIFLNSFMAPEYFPHKNVIEDNMSFFHIDASELDFPETDKIGDYQIELQSNNTAIYNVNDIKLPQNQN